MARPWTEVAADPNYQSLAPNAQETARAAYFQQNVLPNIPKDADATAIRAQFDQQTRPIQPPPSMPSAPEPVAQAIPTAAQHAGSVLDIAKQHPFTSTLGLAENALSGVTGGVGSLADAVTGSLPGTHDFAYQPRTEAGKAFAQAGADEAAAIGRGFTKVAGQGPLAETIKMYGPEALGAVGTVAGLPEVPKGLAGIGRGIKAVRTPGVYLPKDITAQAALDQSALSSKQSMGAAAAAPRVTGASPELQQAIAQSARKTGGAINPEVLSRHLEADTLPVPIQYTEGQATQDPGLISHEQNMRGKHEELRNHFNAQNDKLIGNVQAIRDQIGPDVFTTNQVEHGDALINAYKEKDAVAKADIKAKYQALNDANGGQFPVDGQTFVAAADQALAKQLKGRYVPSEIKADMADFRAGTPMTFEQFENLRTNLAAESRKAERSGDGNAQGAINIVREQLESLPMGAETAQIKPLADAARTAAKARFDALRADPAYKAAVHEKVAPDDFMRRFVIGGKRDKVAVMRQNLSDNPTAVQTLGVSALDHLRDQAGISPDYKGNFTQAGYNKALRGLDPKLQSLVDPKTAETLQNLGNVARNIQFQPKGSFVNNSNTFVAAAADKAAGALEGAANVAAGGIPVGTWGRSVIGKIRAGKEVKKSLRSGAGLENLSTRDQIAGQLP